MDVHSLLAGGVLHLAFTDHIHQFEVDSARISVNTKTRRRTLEFVPF